ncbi:MAG: DNA repair exonuclease [Halanaerobiales bacterium]|nr:DNA repair exonuclease [Halanaerobiales bacterium]
MKPSVKFIHTADLHLGSRIQLNKDFDSDLDEGYKNAVYNSFDKIIEAAIENDVNFLIISGDVFDNESRSVKATRYFKEKCEKLKEHGINIYLINGNHDPYRREGELLQLPKNVKICDTEEVSTFEIYEEGKLIARVLGQSYRGSSESRKMCTFYTAPDQSVYNIGLLHTQLDPNDSNYVPVSKKDLLDNEHIDYWALGHIHQNQVINDHIPYIIYPGIPQGRDIGETGIGGYYLVNLEPENTYYEFKKTSDYIFERLEINLSELNKDTLSELIYFLKKEIDKYYESLDKEVQGYIIRVLLKGKTNLYDMFQEQEEEAIEDIINNLRSYYSGRMPSMFINDVVNRTSKKIQDLDYIIEKDPFIKELISFMSNIKGNEEKVEDIKKQMGDIWNPQVDLENQDPKEFQITDQILEELFEEAKDEIIKEIIERRDL